MYYYYKLQLKKTIFKNKTLYFSMIKSFKNYFVYRYTYCSFQEKVTCCNLPENWFFKFNSKICLIKVVFTLIFASLWTNYIWNDVGVIYLSFFYKTKILDRICHKSKIFNFTFKKKLILEEARINLCIYFINNISSNICF